MPSLVHEAPLEVMRSDPAVVPALLREALGVELPAFATAEDASADFTQPLPAEFRADLVVHLRAGPPDRALLMGIVVEIQRTRDDDKRFSWPLYVAALHARLKRPASLVVLATDDAVARWAAAPITSYQHGAFTPLVIGPSQIPRVGRDRALREPSLAVLSALAHGNGPDGLEVTRAALIAIDQLADDRATVFYDLICASLGDVMRRAMEDDMDYENYEFRSEFLRAKIARGREEGREEGRLFGVRRMVVKLATARIGEIEPHVLSRIDACEDVERLEALLVNLGTAGDPVAVENLLHEL